MKKLLCAVLIISSLLLSACGEAEETPVESPSASLEAQTSPTPSEEPEEVQVLSKGTGFVITEVRNAASVKYCYTITALDGTEIESAACGMQPKVAAVGKNLIGMRFYSDKGSWCRYYDIERGIASESYYGAFWDDGSLVAYNDFEFGRCLVVKSIFDVDGYCAKSVIDSDELVLTVIAAVPSSDGSILTVEYYLGSDGDRTSVEIPLK